MYVACRPLMSRIEPKTSLGNGRPEWKQRPAGPVGIDPVNVDVLWVISAGDVNRALAVVVVPLRQLLGESRHDELLVARR